MFKIILESANGEQLDRVYDANNVEYLQQDEAEFAMLGELSTCSYDVFSSKDMDQLLDSGVKGSFHTLDLQRMVWFELKGILPVNSVRMRLQRRISWKTSR